MAGRYQHKMLLRPLAAAWEIRGGCSITMKYDRTRGVRNLKSFESSSKVWFEIFGFAQEFVLDA